MSSTQLAFLIGLFGSVHCVGMCGPLAFAVPFTGNSRWLLVWDKLLYQAGRIVSYCLLGAITGLLGKQLWLSGLQQVISIGSGLIIIGVAAARLFSQRGALGSIDAFGPLNKLLTYALRNRAGHLFIGMLNGLLPCGFVYFALIAAFNTSSVLSSVNFMLCFGLGTVPLMLAATLGAGMLKPLVRNRINRVMPYVMLMLGVWFVLRGLTLDIPYLSPAKGADAVICR